jgi:hypothetical protein
LIGSISESSVTLQANAVGKSAKGVLLTTSLNLKSNHNSKLIIDRPTVSFSLKVPVLSVFVGSKLDISKRVGSERSLH